MFLESYSAFLFSLGVSVSSVWKRHLNAEHDTKTYVKLSFPTLWRSPIIKKIWGAFHLVKISGTSSSAVNGTRFVGSSHWKIPRKSGKSKKVGLFSRLEFPNGMSCSIYVSLSLYQFQVHRRAPRRTGVYDQMEQLFTNRKFHFYSHRDFRVFFLNGKRPWWSIHMRNFGNHVTVRLYGLWGR